MDESRSDGEPNRNRHKCPRTEISTKSCNSFSSRYYFVQSVWDFKNPHFNSFSDFLKYLNLSSAISIAGASNDQNDAAVITPAAKPREISGKFFVRSFKQIIIFWRAFKEK